MRLSGVHVYPVKSVRPLDPVEADVQPWGLAGDRRWLVTDPEGSLLTARVEPKLLQVGAEIGDGGALTLRGPHAAPLTVRPPESAVARVTVWKSTVDATPAAEEASAWFGELLGRDVRLNWLDDPTRRVTDPEFGLETDRVSFADGYPLLLATTESLSRLNDWIAEGAAERGETPPEPLTMRRFRPNLVVSGADAPFAEDGWRRIRVGDVDFRVTKPCGRCVLTTIDPDTLDKGKEPLRTLARHRKVGQELLFGTNLIPDGVDAAHSAPDAVVGTVRVGDAVTVLD